VCPIAVHDARHTCATLLVDLDVYTCVIMRILRHADQASRWRSTQTRAGPPRARHSGDLASPCTRWSSMSRKRTMSGVVVAVLLCCTPSQPAGSTASNLALTSENSGANGTRTRNPLLAKQVRYQLRHGPSAVNPLMGGPATEDENPHQASAPACVHRVCSQAGGTVHSLLSDGTDYLARHVARDRTRGLA
jgi:hypothetical protein